MNSSDPTSGPNPTYLAVAFLAGMALLVMAFGQQLTGTAEAATAGEDALTAYTPLADTPTTSPAGPSVDVDRAEEPAADQPLDAPPRSGVVQRPVVSVPSVWPGEIDELLGRYRLYWQAYAAAFGRTSAEADHQVLRSLSTEANWLDLEQQLSTFAADGVVLDRVDDRGDRHRLRLPHDGVLRGEEGEEVVLQDCWFDEFIVGSLDQFIVGSLDQFIVGSLDAPARSSGEESTSSDEPTLLNVVMRVEGGQWRVHGIRRATSASAGYGQCLEQELGE